MKTRYHRFWSAGAYLKHPPLLYAVLCFLLLSVVDSYSAGKEEAEASPFLKAAQGDVLRLTEQIKASKSELQEKTAAALRIRDTISNLESAKQELETRKGTFQEILEATKKTEETRTQLAILDSQTTFIGRRLQGFETQLAGAKRRLEFYSARAEPLQRLELEQRFVEDYKQFTDMLREAPKRDVEVKEAWRAICKNWGIEPDTAICPLEWDKNKGKPVVAGCSVCGGTGKCPHCSGKGGGVRNSCPYCDGTGTVRVTCSSCKGSGKSDVLYGQQCKYCNGTGRKSLHACARCAGSGLWYVNCKDCGGKSICSKCKGNGKSSL